MTYKTAYETWLNEPSLTQKEVDTLRQMSEKEIEDSFYQELSFGTGGIRGLMGLGPNRINIYTIRKVTLGLAKYLLTHQKLNGVAIAYDNRFGSKEFAHEAAKVLASNGIKSYIYKELRPTPMLSFLVRHFKTSAGIMLTASHNPKEYNGFKAYNETGAQLNTIESEMVVKKINTVFSPFNISAVDNELIHWVGDEIDEIYLNEVKKLSIHKDQKDLKLVYSPLHGTGGPVIPKLLRSEGYEVIEVSEQMVVDPAFSATKSSNPEEALSYEKGIEVALEHDADLVFVTDPDADRLGVGVKSHGKFKLLTGNQTASIIIYYLLSEKKWPKGFVYTTVVTTNLIKEIAKAYDQNIGETLTGFKFIGEQAHKIEGKEAYIFGCEESYGSLIKDFVRDKDAVQAVYMLAEIGNTLKHQGMTLIDYLEVIYKRFGYYVESTMNISLKGIEGAKKIQTIMSYFRKNGLHIEGFKVNNSIDYIHGHKNPHDITLPPSDVLKYEHNDGFIVFRPSGTEPKLKVYFSTKKDSLEKANSYVDALKNKVSQIIDTL